jgi:hypothetical protein
MRSVAEGLAHSPHSARPQQTQMPMASELWVPHFMAAGCRSKIRLRRKKGAFGRRNLSLIFANR